VDLSAYHTIESADDLEALRRALAAPQLVLWGASYGTHLALAAVRRHPRLASRVILAGVVGPDDTWKLPGATDRLLEAIDSLDRRGPAPGREAPGLARRLAAVASRLDSQPARVTLPRPGGEAGDRVTVAMGGYDFRTFIAATIGSAEGNAGIPWLIEAAARGDLTGAAPFILRTRQLHSIGSAMAYATLCASGVSESRRRQIEMEAARSPFGRVFNLAAVACDVWGVPDLGADFRRPVQSDVPALLISGTLDTTTPLADAEAALRGLPRGQHLIVDGARHGHDLLVGSPRIAELMLAFLRGEPLATHRIAIDAVPR
jgi:pimeloyl-ACP methyl ester carboxylesterase